MHLLLQAHVGAYLSVCLPAVLQDPHKQSAGHSRRCQWKVFYSEQVIAAAGSSIQDVIVITKGAMRMNFPAGTGPQKVKQHTVVASVGGWLKLRPSSWDRG